MNPTHLSLSDRLDDARLTMAVSLGLSLWWIATHEEASGSDPHTLAPLLAVPDVPLQRALARTDSVDALAAEFVCPVGVMAERVRQVLGKTQSGSYPRVGTAC